MTANPKITFDRDRAEQYDLDIRKAIPGYEALHAMAQSILIDKLPTSANLLVVGSGTGMELINYCQECPQWLLTGVDPSEAMMAIAKQELSVRGLFDRVNLHTGYLNTLVSNKLMDAATSMLVMHFIPDDGSKLDYLKNVARHLKPGADLILADLHGDRSTANFTRLKTAWQAFYFNRLDEIARSKAELEFETSIDKSIFFVSETRIIELLNKAGFNCISRFYNAFLFGGWMAKYVGS